MSAIVYGIHAVAAALQKKGVAELCVNRSASASGRLARLVDDARHGDVAIRYVADDELARLAGGGRHQGVVACLAADRVSSPRQDVIGYVQGLDHPPLLLILDGVQDPHNLGACLRSADAAGVDGVVVPRDKAAGVTPTVRKVACGAAEALPFFQVTNLARTLRELKALGVWLVGAAGEARTSLYEAELTGALALVMGAEEKGLRRLTREHCDVLVNIPMMGSVESLNVSVAAGVCLFEAARQRHGWSH